MPGRCGPLPAAGLLRDGAGPSLGGRGEKGRGDALGDTERARGRVGGSAYNVGIGRGGRTGFEPACQGQVARVELAQREQ